MKKYDSNLIYFGNLVHTLEDGEWFSSNNVYEKIDEETYRLVINDKSFKTFKEDLNNNVGCSDLYPLSAIIGSESKMLTMPMIKLYRLKYKLLCGTNNLQEDIVVSKKYTKNK